MSKVNYLQLHDRKRAFQLNDFSSRWKTLASLVVVMLETNVLLIHVDIPGIVELYYYNY